MINVISVTNMHIRREVGRDRVSAEPLPSSYPVLLGYYPALLGTTLQLLCSTW